MCAHNHFVFYVKYKKKGKQQKKVNILSSKDLAYSTGLLYRINMLLNVPTSQLSVVKSLFGHSFCAVQFYSLQQFLTMTQSEKVFGER